MMAYPEKANVRVLRNTLSNLIVTPGFRLNGRQSSENQQGRQTLVNQAWEVYTSFPGTRMDEKQFKADLERTLFIDQHSVDTYLLAVLRLPFN